MIGDGIKMKTSHIQKRERDDQLVGEKSLLMMVLKERKDRMSGSWWKVFLRIEDRKKEGREER